MSLCHGIPLDKRKCGPMEHFRAGEPAASLEVMGRSVGFV